MTTIQPLRSVAVTRYVTPLREGGSLPAIAEAEDGFLYVIKFRGAGQGTKALIADLIGAELARAAGFHVPELVFAQLDEAFGRTEPDEEIQDLLKASTGLNLGVHYLSGAITYDPAVKVIDDTTASRIVWLDAFLMNVDRTSRNTNMLQWRNELWLIDHGASLYFHHSWQNWEEQVSKPFVQINQHVLLPVAKAIAAADVYMQTKITPDVIDAVVALIPNDWLAAAEPSETTDSMRAVYASFLKQRLVNASLFVNQAIQSSASLI